MEDVEGLETIWALDFLQDPEQVRQLRRQEQQQENAQQQELQNNLFN